MLNRRERHNHKTIVRQKSSEVRDILRAWEPIPDSPPDEYDCLVDRVVSALHRGVGSEAELANLICDEFQNHFGFPVGRPEVEAVAKKIIATARLPRGPQA